VLVGFNCAVDLRLPGVARQIPVRATDKFFPVMWIGFWINLITGLVLLAADAKTKMTSWVFGVKLLSIALAMLVLLRLQETCLEMWCDRGERHPPFHFGGTAGRNIRIREYGFTDRRNS
jgi:hypothetical protein